MWFLPKHRTDVFFGQHSRLNGYDVAALELLVEQGRVEAGQHKINAPIQERWEYRIKE
jgi:hypothetical protein